MSTNTSVGYKCETFQHETGAAWNAITPSEPSSYYGGINYTFHFVNNTSTTDTTCVSFDYDLSSLLNACKYGQVSLTDASSSVTGTVAPGATVSVSLITATTSSIDADDNCMSLQIGAANLITNLTDENYQVCFWFSTNDGNSTSYQQIAICDTGNGTALPISSWLKNESSEQAVESSTAGVNVFLNAGGQDLNTNNIYIQVYPA
jgi:hypothetical protein